MIEQLRRVGKLSKISVKTEADCSSLVRACCIQDGFDPGNFNTASEASALKATGDVYKRQVQDVYNYIVSPNDRSARLLPTGTAELTCAAATTVAAVSYTHLSVLTSRKHSTREPVSERRSPKASQRDLISMPYLRS